MYVRKRTLGRWLDWKRTMATGGLEMACFITELRNRNAILAAGESPNAFDANSPAMPGAVAALRAGFRSSLPAYVSAYGSRAQRRLRAEHCQLVEDHPDDAIGGHDAAIRIVAWGGRGIIEFVRSHDALSRSVDQARAKREAHPAGCVAEVLVQPNDFGVESQVAPC